MSLSVKRWFILVAGLVAMVCQGMMYTGSVYMKRLGEVLERPSELWSQEWGVIYALGAAGLPVGMLLAGKLADMGYVRLTTILGAVLLSSGLVLAGFSDSVVWTGATLGAMTSIGSGCAYGTIIATMIRWFPDRRGLASGMAVSAVGLGPTILAPVAKYLLDTYDVMNMFKILGVVVIIGMGVAAIFLSVPPDDFVPEGWTPPASAADTPKSVSSEDLNWKQMLGVPLFWLFFITNICALFSGLLVNGLAVPIGVELAGLDVAKATWAVMLFSLGSASGRVLWGTLSDYLGRVFMIGAAFTITASTMFLLYMHVSTPGVYLPCVFVAGMCYGGVFGTFPSLNADSFGTKNSAVNLAVLYFSFSASAFIAPQVVAVYRNGGIEEYPKAFLVAGCIAVVGLILSIIVGKVVKARKTKNA